MQNLKSFIICSLVLPAIKSKRKSSFSKFIQREGDIDGDNYAGAVDISDLVAAFNLRSGIDEDYDEIPDFDCNGIVGSIDLSGLITNYNLQGEAPGTNP